MHTFQFTQPKRTATRRSVPSVRRKSVSIHAAQVGCDKYINLPSLFEKVSIHAAQVGCDAHFVIIGFNSFVFQFTQPKRAATPCQCAPLSRYGVSIHAAQAGCDNGDFVYITDEARFNSRSPSGLRHAFPAKFSIFSPVSIHAAQAGCDAYAYNRNNDRKVSIHAAQAGCDFRDRSAYCFE